MKIVTYMALFLDAPMQSWGYESRFDRRTTLSYPTRSGIIGMICAAMGIDRIDTEGLKIFEDMRMTSYILQYGSQIIDFHTVGGGYDLKTERQNMSQIAGGGTPKTVLTNRNYLCDAKFGVVLEGKRDALGEIAIALQNPRWGIWFGRKTCIPASHVFQGIFESREEALSILGKISGCEIKSYVMEDSRFADALTYSMIFRKIFLNVHIFPEVFRSNFRRGVRYADI